MAREGFASIRQISSGEIMHSRTPPMEEARRLYVEQSNLAERVRLSADENPESAAPLVIWDVGLGAAANAMAAILCYEEQAAHGPVRPLHIISFENDLDSLRLAFRHSRDFPYLRHGGPAGILKTGQWQSRQHPGLSWLLVPGDFLETMSTAPAPPDLIFYDMFSSKTSGDQWTLERLSPVLRRLRRARRRTFHLHLLDREPRRAARRRLLRRERTQRRRKAGDHHRAHARGVSRVFVLPARAARARVAGKVESLRRQVPGRDPGGSARLVRAVDPRARAVPVV